MFVLASTRLSLAASGLRTAAAPGLLLRWQSTASASYKNILVDTVGANKDVSLITLNRPKAVSGESRTGKREGVYGKLSSVGWNFGLGSNAPLGHRHSG